MGHPMISTGARGGKSKEDNYICEGIGGAVRARRAHVSSANRAQIAQGRNRRVGK